MRGAASALRIGIALITLLLAVATLFRWDRQLHSIEDTPSRILLSLLGLAVGAWMIRVLAAGARKLHKTFLFGLGAITVSQVCYHGLVWAGWKPHTLVWRVWWLSVVVSALTTHLVWLHFVGADQTRWRRLAITSACVASALLASLCLGTTPLPDWPTWYMVATAAFTVFSTIASIVLWLRMRHRRGWQFTWWVKALWILGAQAAVVAVAFYTGRVTAPYHSEFEAMPSALATVPHDELEAQLAADLNRLRIVAQGLDDLIARTTIEARSIHDTRVAEKRDYFLPAEEDRVRAAFMSYLAYRAALLRLATTYGGYASVSDPLLRARCFLVAYAAGASVYDSSLFLVRTFGAEPQARAKLNEADPKSGIAAGMLDRIEEAVTSDRNRELFDAAGKFFDENRDRWHAARVLADDQQLKWLEHRIERGRAALAEFASNDPTLKGRQLARRVGRDIYQPYYAAQSLISTWIGDTRLVARPPFISEQQIAQMKKQLQPGDIFLERRNWFASNAFLPGFWPHAALYTGTINDLEHLGLVRKDEIGKWTSDDPSIRDRLPEYLKPAEDGAAHTVLESVSEGVIFNSLEESMHADYVAVLRPRLTDAQKAKALATAFSHQGKPYDFEFDFFSADKLVCTELVYRSYAGMLHFDLVKIMGRDTLPALEICRKFAAERTLPDDKRQLDFVMFLDAVPSENAAKLASEDEFCQSAARPRGFNE